eukprot:jgi/Phyca11/105322/e_gw1.10.739.1
MPSAKKRDSSTKPEASQEGPRKLRNTNKRASTQVEGRAVGKVLVVADSSPNEETKTSAQSEAAETDASSHKSAYNLSKHSVEDQNGATTDVLISSSTIEIGASAPTSISTTETEATDPSATGSAISTTETEATDLTPAQPLPAHYVSPVERYRLLRSEQSAGRQIVSTVEQMQVFIRANDVNQPAVRVRLQFRGRVVWTSTHIVKTGELARIHIVDLHAPESLQKLQQAFRDNYDRDYSEVDQLLVTATIFGCTAKSPGIPPDGAIVTITNPSKVNLFMGKACQLNTRLANISIEGEAASG